MRISCRNIMLSLTVCVTILCATARSQEKAQDNTPKYRNPGLAIEDRVADLLSRMTLEEKVQQITGGGRGEMEVIDPTGTFTTETARAMLRSWSDPDLDMTPRKSAILRNGVQRYLNSPWCM